MKILCPKHPDSNPSMEVYPEGGFCFACGAFVPIDKLENYEDLKIEKKIPEDPKLTIQYIKSLCPNWIRGLRLPADERGYYILWPCETYYKIRTWKGRTRYLGVRGKRPPAFVLEGGKDILVVVEGELNALSLKEAYPSGVTIISPGAASEFPRHLGVYQEYDKIVICVDNDPPGIAYGTWTKECLLKIGKSVKLVIVSEDFNETLQRAGPDGVKLEFEELLK